MQVRRIVRDGSATIIDTRGRDGAQARKLAEAMSTRPWHNVAYFPGTFAALAAALEGKVSRR